MANYTEEEKKKAVEKIHKLLALAGENGFKQDNINEGSSAMKKALELMDKYGMRFADLEKKKDDGGYDTKIKSFRLSDQANSDWVMHLVNMVADIFTCQVLILKGPRGHDDRFSVVGFDSDIEMLTWYFNYLKIRISKMGDAHKGKASDRRDYCHGVTVAVVKRMREMFKQARKEESEKTTALVVVKTDAVSEAFKKAFPKTSFMKSKVSRHSKSFLDGYADGHDVNINRVVK